MFEHNYILSCSFIICAELYKISKGEMNCIDWNDNCFALLLIFECMCNGKLRYCRIQRLNRCLQHTPVSLCCLNLVMLIAHWK